jgi:hypothetical protein
MRFDGSKLALMAPAFQIFIPVTLLHLKRLYTQN